MAPAQSSATVLLCIQPYQLGGGWDGVKSKRLLNGIDPLAEALDIRCNSIIESLRAVRALVAGFENRKSFTFFFVPES